MTGTTVSLWGDHSPSGLRLRWSLPQLFHHLEGELVQVPHRVLDRHQPERDPLVQVDEEVT